MDNLQHQRFELKYLVSEKIAAGVRDFVSSYLMLDKYGATQPDLSYLIHSLYLDSDDLAFYWQTINGNKNRYKLRLRYYNETSPVFFEIKRRMNNAILKERGAVRRDAVTAMLAGQLPSLDELPSPEPGQIEALEHFCQLMQAHNAKPKATWRIAAKPGSVTMIIPRESRWTARCGSPTSRRPCCRPTSKIRCICFPTW